MVQHPSEADIVRLERGRVERLAPVGTHLRIQPHLGHQLLLHGLELAGGVGRLLVQGVNAVGLGLLG